MQQFLSCPQTSTWILHTLLLQQGGSKTYLHRVWKCMSLLWFCRNLQLARVYYVPTVIPTRCTCLSNYLFLHNTLHVSDGLSVHHQEFKTVHTATGICQADTATCLLAGTRWNSMEFLLLPASKQTAISLWHMPVAVCKVLNSWWWTERPSETRRMLRKNK
jgi:hypothetical protein